MNDENSNVFPPPEPWLASPFSSPSAGRAPLTPREQSSENIQHSVKKDEESFFGTKQSSRSDPTKAEERSHVPAASSSTNKGESSMGKRTRPPQHKTGPSAKKYLPVQSSGYGVKRSSSTSSLSRLAYTHVKSSGYGSDDARSTASSTSSRSKSTARSGSATSFRLQRNKALSNKQRGNNLIPKTNSVPRIIRSVPSSPIADIDDNSTISSSRSIRSASSSNSNWATQQREKQRERQLKTLNLLKDDRSTNSATFNAASYAGINDSLKRSNPLGLGSFSNKAPKKEAASTPRSGSTESETKLFENRKTPRSETKRSAVSPFRATPKKNTPGSNKKSATPLSWSQMRGKLTPPRIARQILVDEKDRIDLMDCDPNKSEVNNLSDALFPSGSGISDEEVRKVLNKKISSAKQWELKKKLADADLAVQRLKDILNSLVRAKSRLTMGAAEVEKNAKIGWKKSLQKLYYLDEERQILKKDLKELEEENVGLNDHLKDTKRTIQHSEHKVTCLEDEIIPLKDALAAAEKAHTEASIALAVAESRSDEATKQAEEWRSEIAALETSKSEAVKEAEASILSAMERENVELREECATMRTKILDREGELRRLVNVADDSSGESLLDGIKRELDILRNNERETKARLLFRDSELARAVADFEAAESRAIAKDNDLRELMKGLGDIQRSGQAREEDANDTRKAAESRVREMELELADLRTESSVFAKENETLKEILERTRAEVDMLGAALTDLKVELQSHKSEASAHSSELQFERELRARAEQKEQEERQERIALTAQMMAMTQEHARAEAKLKEINESLERQWRETTEDNVRSLNKKDETISRLTEAISGLEGERDSLKHALNDKKTMANAANLEEIGRLNGEINAMKERLRSEERRALSLGNASADQVQALEAQIREGLAERRRMHNTIQELRGNIRVFARVRPFLPGDNADDNAEPAIRAMSDVALEIAKQNGSERTPFTFDRIFAPSAGQDSVFTEVHEFVQSALDGYHVCLFSYGQTGSGKTHTMMGSGNGAMRGIVPRAVEQILSQAKTLESQNWKFEMTASFLEIYNEELRDLLASIDSSHKAVSETPSKISSSTPKKVGANQKIAIKRGKNGKSFVDGLTQVDINTENSDCGMEQLQNVMATAARARSVATTKMNSQSSRSHSVFILNLRGHNEDSGEVVQGALNLCDLAGSERLDRSGATGDRLKETQAINKSLSCLGDVFNALAKGASHVPYRNSKLTYLLQDCLSGDGKALMFVNLSPTAESINESVCSLRFAQRVNQVELGKPIKNVQYS